MKWGRNTIETQIYKIIYKTNFKRIFQNVYIYIDTKDIRLTASIVNQKCIHIQNYNYYYNK